MRGRAGRYSLAQRALHWSVALLAIAAWGLGQTIEEYGFEGLVAAFGQDATNAIYTLHKSAGLLVLFLMVLRIAARLAWGKPAYAQPLPGWMRAASEATHFALYALLILMPVLGWLATGAGDYPVQLFALHLPKILPKDPALSETLYGLHAVCGSLVAALVALHVGAALWHGLARRDGVFSRMI